MQHHSILTPLMDRLRPGSNSASKSQQQRLRFSPCQRAV